MNTQEKAFNDLQLIRNTMERSTQLTSVSGIGLMAMGLIGLAGAYAAALRNGYAWWPNTWGVVAIVGFAIGLISMWYKGERTGSSIFTGAGKRFIFSLSPPIVAGTVLSERFVMIGRDDLLAGTWLLLYGAGVITAGAYSIRVIPIMGIVFMILGTFAVFAPASFLEPQFGVMTGQDLLLAAGFGGIHIAFGAIIAWRHGG